MWERQTKEGLRLLPPAEWMIKPCGPGHVALGAWEDVRRAAPGRRGMRHFIKVALADLPDDLTPPGMKIGVIGKADG